VCRPRRRPRCHRRRAQYRRRPGADCSTVAEADQLRAAAILDRAAVERAAETFLATAHATSELNATAESANAILEGADPSDRRAAKAREALSAMSTQAWAWADEAIAARRRVNDESASVAATADAPALTQAPSEPVAPAGEPDAPKNADRESGMSAGPDIFDQIRKLGELRDAGLLTAEEFDTKKIDLLSRL
jgi:hypothetical protein